MLVVVCALGTVAGLAVATDAAPAGAAAPPLSGAYAGGMNLSSELEARFASLPAAEQTALLSSIRASGVTWLRVRVAFTGVLDSRGRFTGAYTWPADPLIRAARAAGFKVLATLGASPWYARLADGSPDPTMFATFAAAAATRYYPLGVTAYEIWNRPNTAHYWGAKVNPAAYTTLLKAAYAAIKAAKPGAGVLTGALMAVKDNPDGSYTAPLTFLTALYANGAKGSFDAVTANPYGLRVATQPDPASPWTYLPALNQLMVAKGDGAKRIWLTEYGPPTTGANSVSEATQALMFTQAFAVAQTWAWAGPLFAASWQDTAAGPAGLVRADGSAKPALGILPAAINPALAPAPAPRRRPGSTSAAPTRPPSGPCPPPSRTRSWPGWRPPAPSGCGWTCPSPARWTPPATSGGTPTPRSPRP